MKAVYKLADIDIEVDSVYQGVHQMLVEYSSGGAPLFSVRTREEDIAREEEFWAVQDRKRDIEPYQRPLYYLEAMVLYRKIADRLPFYNAFLIHGSALAMDGVAYLFTALSGTGKSTHARLWREMFGERVVTINDDKPLIRLTEDGHVMIYGTPYDGKHHLSNPIALPLKAICLLERGEINEIHPAETGASLPRLMEAIYRPKNPTALAASLGVLNQVLAKIKLYRLSCNLDPEAARISYEGMQ